jgi:DNA-binding response OmpR family regulator
MCLNATFTIRGVYKNSNSEMIQVQQSTHTAKAVVVDDDNVFGSILSSSLARENYQVEVIDEYQNAAEFIDKCISSGGAAEPDVVILDYHLDNGKTGLDLCRKIRSRSDVPIIMLTGNKSLETTVACLENGADQYMVKPFEVPELIARINVCKRIRRGRVTDSRKIEAPGLALMLDERRLVGPKRKVHLTEKECCLAEVLLRSLNSPVTKDDLRQHIYGTADASNIQSRNLDVLVGRLRKKLAAFSNQFRIYSMRNVGYKLVQLNHG